MRKLVAEMIEYVKGFERYMRIQPLTDEERENLPPARQPLLRERSEKEQKVFEAGIEVLVCDLIHRVLTSENGDGYVFVSMSNALKADNVYRAPSDSTQFPLLVRRMSQPDLDLIDYDEEHHTGANFNHQRTIIRAGGKLRRAAEHLTTDDLALDRSEEIIIQKTDKKDPRNIVEGRSEWISYPKKHRKAASHRRKVREINDYIAEQDIEYTGRLIVDTTAVRLRRYFNNATFSHGGRLFGGFWQNLSKIERQNHLKINGKYTAGCDYANMQAAIAYATLKVPFDTERDAYDVGRWQTKEGRTGIKKIFAAMTFARKPLKNWPKDDDKPVLSYFPVSTRLRDVTNAIEKRHPALAKAFYKGRGFKYMFRESQILVDVLMQLKAEGIPALPVHDCLITAEKHAWRTEQIMVAMFKNHLGGSVKVDFEGHKGTKVRPVT
jgi:hypothetical protein